MAPLIGKPLAVSPTPGWPAGMAASWSSALLAISGEDFLTVNGKYRDQWTGKLPAAVPDHQQRAAAIRRRLRRDRRPVHRAAAHDVVAWPGGYHLEARIRAQLPGVLNWALMGLAQLETKGGSQPSPRRTPSCHLDDLVSPIRASCATAARSISRMRSRSAHSTRPTGIGPRPRPFAHRPRRRSARICRRAAAATAGAAHDATSDIGSGSMSDCD